MVSGNLLTAFPIMNKEVCAPFQENRKAEGNSNEIQGLLLILHKLPLASNDTTARLSLPPDPITMTTII